MKQTASACFASNLGLGTSKQNKTKQSGEYGLTRERISPLSYPSPVDHLKNDIVQLEKFQKEATQMIKGMECGKAALFGTLVQRKDE